MHKRTPVQKICRSSDGNERGGRSVANIKERAIHRFCGEKGKKERDVIPTEGGKEYSLTWAFRRGSGGPSKKKRKTPTSYFSTQKKNSFRQFREKGGA